MQAPWAAAGLSAQAPPAAEDRQIPGQPLAAPSSFAIKGWKFSGESKPILSTHETDRWTKELEMTLPEMVFGDSVLEVKNEELGFKYSFNAYDALRACGKEAGIKVSMSQNWMKNAEQDIPDAQPFDWTYSTPYRGTAASLVDGRPVDPVDTSERIDFESLKFWHACMLPVLAMPLLCVDSFSAFTWSAPAYKKCAPRAGDEILWSADVYLFQDELHDNGDCALQVRIRVTLNYFYILQRLFVRVDNVCFRIKETRLHHRFGDPHALRQYTERQDDYDAVVASCTAKELRDGILHDANQLLLRISVQSDQTEKFQLMAPAILMSAPEVRQPSQAEIAEQTHIAESAFKKKFGNLKPSAGALMQRQKKHETRFFDSGDAFSTKASDKLPPAPGQEEEEPPQPILCEEDLTRRPSFLGGEEGGAFRRVGSCHDKSPVVQPSHSEIDEQTRVAEVAFKKKFGNLKPSAGALMQRQKKHESRFFDSGDAFSKKACDKLPLAPGQEEEKPPQPILSEEDLPKRFLSAETTEVNKVVQPSQAEIEEQTRVAEAAFKKKFGNLKPSAGALMQRQKKHESRFFDSGDAFSTKASDRLPPAPGQEEEEPPQPILCEDDLPKRTASSPVEVAEVNKVVQPSHAEMKEQTLIAEQAFKKKYGGLKPSAGALLQRQKKHETRFFDSGDAFSTKASDKLPPAPGQEVQEPPQPILSEEDLTRRPSAMGEESVHFRRTHSLEQSSAVLQPSKADMDEQTKISEAAFKKKFGNIKPSAGALMQRQKKHETRFFDSGDAFSTKASDKLPLAPGQEAEELPPPILSGDDIRHSTQERRDREAAEVAARASHMYQPSQA